MFFNSTPSPSPSPAPPSPPNYASGAPILPPGPQNGSYGAQPVNAQGMPGSAPPAQPSFPNGHLPPLAGHVRYHPQLAQKLTQFPPAPHHPHHPPPSNHNATHSNSFSYTHHPPNGPYSNHHNGAAPHQSAYMPSPARGPLGAGGPNHSQSHHSQHSGTVGPPGSQLPPTPSAPITPAWSKQLENATISRASSTAHHHARAAQLALRGLAPTALTITDPNRPKKPVLMGGSGVITINGHYVNGKKRTVREEGEGRSQSVNSTRSGTIGTTTAASSPDTSAATSSATAVDGSPNAKSQSATAMQNWTSLDMGGLKLKSLSSSLFTYTFLTTLFVPHNSLGTLSPLISKLTSLTLLDASSNKLLALPPELGLITTLQQLYLFDNHLTTLPPELGTLHQLEDLGIEGNPLSENILSRIQTEGTASLIAYLRDSCPVPLPPTERDWVTIDADFALPSLPTSANSVPPPPPETFTALSYNILCERYATDRMFGYTPSWALNWDYRKDLILQEILQYGADVVCLQEVGVEQYEDFFLAQLSEQGYDGVFYPKSRHRTMGAEERRHVDGCATFFKTATFALVEQELVEFNQIAMRSELKKTDDMFNRVLNKDNIAIIATLEHRASGARQVVANIHNHWDPEFRDVKLLQVAMLMDQIEKISDRFARYPPRRDLAPGYTSAPTYVDGSQIPTIMCGDINSVPESGVYEYLSRGFVDANHDDLTLHKYGSMTANGLRHRLKGTFKSAYSHIGELNFTNYTPGFKEVIDYIWYSTSSLSVTTLLGKIDDAYLEKVVGFPNAHFASDHVPLLVEFKVKPST